MLQIFWSSALKRRLTLILLTLLVATVALVAALALTTKEVTATDSSQTSGAAVLKAAHVGSTNPGFATGECPDATYSQIGKYGWHFVFQGSTTEFNVLTVQFQNAGIIVDAVDLTLPIVYDPFKKHAYVWTTGPDTLLAASATTTYTGTQDVEFNLSHVCTPVLTPTPSPSPTNTPTPPPTNTPTPPPTNTPTPTPTSTPTNTPTVTPTSTPIPPTMTPTRVPPTATPTLIPPTATPTGTVPAATPTVVPPTQTPPIITICLTCDSTATPTSTATRTPTLVPPAQSVQSPPLILEAPKAPASGNSMAQTESPFKLLGPFGLVIILFMGLGIGVSLYRLLRV